MLRTLGDSGTRFEFECYDTSHLYNLAHFLERGLVQAAAVRADRVRHSRRHRPASRRRDAHEADCRPAVRQALQMVGARRWAQSAAIAAQAAAMGGNVRVGPRGFPVGRAGPAGDSNAEQVRAARQIIEGLGLSVASPDEARDILELKGGDRVAF